MNRSLENRSQKALLKNARGLSLLQRLDIVLTLGVVMAIAALMAGWWLFVHFGRIYGWFDRPAIQPLADERVLENVRDDLADHPILDAVFQPEDNRIYIAQSGGTIHRYEPATHLWSSKRPFDGEPISQDFILMQAENQAIWLLGADGSLGRYDGSHGEVIISNTAFVGQDGQPVASDDLIAATLSADGRWVVLATRDNELGMYDSEQRRWLTSVSLGENGSPGQITRLIWWRDSAWIATPVGLYRLSIGGDGGVLEEVADVSGHVVDLDADPIGDLWILEKRDCVGAGGANNCVWLGHLANPNSAPRTVIDERNHYPDLNLGDLTFAQQVGDELVLAGQAGIYRYDTQQHSWEQLLDEGVTAVLSEHRGDGFYFATRAFIGRVHNNQLEAQWPLPTDFPQESVVKLLQSADSELFALTESGRLFALSISSGDYSRIYGKDGTELDPNRLTAAAAVKNVIILVGPDGILLHDTRLRRYDDITAVSVDLPDWLLSPNLHLIAVGDALYGMSPGSGSGNLLIHVLPADLAVTTDFYTSGDVADSLIVKEYQVDAPIRDVWSWGNSGLGILDGNGVVYHFSRNAQQAHTDEANMLLDGQSLRDAAAFNNSLVTIAGNRLLEYELNTRTWNEIRVLNLGPNEQMVELLSAENRLLIRTDSGRLLDRSGNVLIGGDTTIPISDSELSDALYQAGNLYLAGNGHIVKYDPDQRAVVEVWQAGGQGESVSLKGIINGEPLALVGGQAVLGETALSSPDETVTNLSFGQDTIWALHDDGNSLYLADYDPDSPGPASAIDCYFRNPIAESATQIFDARALPGGTVAVLADSGLLFYSPKTRSWYESSTSLMGANRLYLLDYATNDYLLLVDYTESGAAKISFVDVSTIKLPDSCSTETARVSVEQTLDARAVDIHESAGHVAWITSNEEVITWREGQSTTVLAQGATPPATDLMRRVYDRQAYGYLLFTTDSELWRYNLDQRAWTKIALDFDQRSVKPVRLNIEPFENGTDEKRDILTVEAEGGHVFYGIFSDHARRIDLTSIANVPPSSLSQVETELVDVQARTSDNSRWTFVFSDGVGYLNPATRTWDFSETLSENAARTFRQAGERGVLVDDVSRTWWVATTRGPHPKEFAQYQRIASDQDLLTEAGAIWRLTVDGEIFKCESTPDKLYQCNKKYSPFLLDLGAVLHAYEVGEEILIETTDGLRVFQKSTGTERTTTPEITSFNQVSATIQLTEGELLLYSDANEQLLLWGSGEPVLFDGVRELVRDNQGLVWARLDAGWRFLHDRSLHAPNPLGIRLFVAMDSTVTGLDASGVPYVWDSSQLISSDLILPDTIVPSTVSWLAPDLRGGWWARTGTEIVHVLPEMCVSPFEPYPVATAQYWADLRSTLAPTEIPVQRLNQPIPPTNTPRPTPTTTPSPISCYYPSRSFIVALGEIVTSAVTDSSVQLVDINGTQVRVSIAPDGQYEIVTDQVAEFPRSLELHDRWGELRGLVTTLPNGQTALNPVTRLVDGDRITAQRLNGELAVYAEDAPYFQDDLIMPAALDAGWLRWKRDLRSFDVRTGTGYQQFPAVAFRNSGHFLFEPVEAISVVGENDFVAANMHGLWAYSQPNLDLNDPSITYYPGQLARPIIPAHGYFLTGSKMVERDAGTLTQQAVSPLDFTVGQVRFHEDMTQATVTAAVPIAGHEVSAFAESGFIWDVDRRSLAINEDELWLQSAAGIHQVLAGLTTFDRGPNRIEIGSGLLQSNGQGTPFVKDASGWYVWNMDVWQPNALDPHANRFLVQSSQWTWSLQNGVLAIQLTGDQYDFKLNTVNGLSFSSDRLRAATSYRDTLFVATDAFLETKLSADHLGLLSADRYPPLTVDRFENFHFSDGTSRLYLYDGPRFDVWDEQQGAFLSTSGPDPTQYRRLAETSRLRFTWIANEVIKEILVDDIVGSSGWVTYAFERQRFPFDIVTSLSYFDGDFYVGTAAGLEVHPDTQSAGFGSLYRLFALGGASQSRLDAIHHVGIPEADPNRVMARSSVFCVERSAGQPFNACSDSSLLNARLRVADSFWVWILTAQDQAIGRYRTANGTLDSRAIDTAGGRFPHDRIQAVTVCQDRAVTVWDTRWVSVYGSSNLELTDPVQNFPLDEARPLKLVCVSEGAQIDGDWLPAGTYLVGQSQTLRYSSSSGWVPVDATEVTAVHAYADAPPVFRSERLRLRQGTSGTGIYEFEHWIQGQHWRTVPWVNDMLETKWRTELDEWQTVELVEERLWVATRLGVQTVERGTDGAYLDLSKMTSVREPLIDGELCPITDMAWRENHLFVRCSASSRLVFSGDVISYNQGTLFIPYSGDDFFAEQLLVDTDYWTWRLVAREGGYSGNIEVYWRGEPVQLVSGQLTIDMLTAVALFHPDRLELTAEPFGWYEVPRTGAHVSVMERPVGIDDARDFRDAVITWVRHDADSPGDSTLLCMARADGDYVAFDHLLNAQERSACFEYAGYDGVWVYERKPDGLAISAPYSVGGHGTRELIDGRFSDQIAIGIPVTGDNTLWLPTQAGVTELSLSFDARDIHVGPFSGLQESALPTALVVDRNGKPAYLGVTEGVRLYRLDETREPLSDSIFTLHPEAGGIRSVVYDEKENLRIQWAGANGYGWSYVMLPAGQVLNSQLLTDITTLDQFYIKEQELSRASLNMTTTFLADRVEIQVVPFALHHLALPHGFSMVEAIPVDDRIIAIGQRDLLDINLGTVLREIANQESSHN